MHCPKCGFQIIEGSKYCNECGANLIDPLKTHSASINHLDSASATFDDLSIIKRYLPFHLSEKIKAARGAIEGERRQITALFADIKDYTPLTEKLGEEEIYHLMDRLYKCMITSVHEEEGNVQKLTGDGIFAIFGAPIALEDAPYRACRAAWSIQQKMNTIGDELEKEKGFRPMARIGIHTGTVVIGTVGTDLRMEFTTLGDTVNLASRLESMAEPGCVYISETTHALAGPYVESNFLGERQIRGKADVQKVYRLEGIKGHAVRFDESLRRGLTPFVGRTDELDTLESYLKEAISGKTLLVQIIGEAGSGKSRIIHEIHKNIKEKGLFYLRANCMSFGQSTSYLPFIEHIKGLFHINDGDSHDAVEQKIEQGLGLLGIELEAKSFLLNFLSFPVRDNSLDGLDVKLISDRTRDILVTLFQKRSLQMATVLAIEDLHWIDPASESLLQQMITNGSNSPLMFLCTTRPEYNAPWLDNPAVKMMRLSQLSRDCVKQMVCSILGSTHVSDNINKMIIEKAGCNPFFTEEITRYLVESRNLKIIEKKSGYELANDKVNVPTTILDLLQERVDKLNEKQKSALQAAAVVGQRFSPKLVQYVSCVNGEFKELLISLEKKDLIFPEQVGNDIEYRFKHALLHDVVYDGMLKPKKERLHRAVGEALEGLYPDRLEEMAENLSYHWSNTDNNDKTVQYLYMAGVKSFRIYALEEAHSRFQHAVSILDSSAGTVDNRLRSELILYWAKVFFFRTSYKNLLEALSCYQSLFEALEDKRKLSLFLYYIGFSNVAGGRFADAKKILDRAYSLAEESNDAEAVANASFGIVTLYSFWTPDNDFSDKKAYLLFTQAENKADEIKDPLLLQNGYYAYIVYLIPRSRYAEVRTLCEKLMGFAKKYNDDRFTAVAQLGLAFCNNMEERPTDALENAAQAMAFAPDHFTRLAAATAKAGANALLGNAQESVDVLAKVKKEAEESNFVLLLGAVHFPMAVATVLSGRVANGIKQIHIAMQYWSSLGNSVIPVRGHAILSDIYLRIALGTGRTSLRVFLQNFWFFIINKPLARRKAKHHLEEVLRKSREYNMPGFLAKALYGLGTLAQAKKKKSAARLYYEEAIGIAEANGLYIAEKIKTALKCL